MTLHLQITMDADEITLDGILCSADALVHLSVDYDGEYADVMEVTITLTEILGMENEEVPARTIIGPAAFKMTEEIGLHHEDVEQEAEAEYEYQRELAEERFRCYDD